MKTNHSITLAILAALSLPVLSFAKAHDDHTLNASDVPKAAQVSADKQATGGKVVRWEKDGDHYDAILSKDGKEWAVTFDEKGNTLSKHGIKGAKHKMH
ncbi:MAG: hypothetical protein ABI839_05030 [Verrucomicrobiota bacterium]